MKEVSSEASPQLFEFKNSLHFGFISSSLHPPTQPPKNPHLSSRDTQFSRSSTSRRLFSPSPSKSPWNVKQNIYGIGLSIDDEGNILVATWVQGKVQGKYFLFKSNIIGDSRMQNQFLGICQYGNMVQGHLEGDNYLYSIQGNIAKATFQQDCIHQKWFLFQQNIRKDSGQQNVECEVYTIQKAREQYSQNEREKLYIPLKEINSKKEQTTKIKEFTELIDPLSFLKSMVDETQQKNESQILISLKCIHLTQQEVFFGFLQKKPKESNSQIYSTREPLNGFGVIMTNSWPSQYGTFVNGTLQGLGRKYQTGLNFQDGFFLNGVMLTGYVFDFPNEKIYFGNNSSIVKGEDPQRNQFIISQAFNLNEVSVIEDFKKNYHLKSLNYINNYFKACNLLDRSPWPYSVICNLQKASHVKQVLKTYHPDSGLPSIPKKLQTAEERTQRDLLDQINNTPTSYRVEKGGKAREMKKLRIKNGIEAFLKEANNQQFQQTLERNIQDYQKIKTVHNLQNDTIDQKGQKKPLSKRSHQYYNLETPNQISSKEKYAPEALPLDQYNLTELLKFYRECQIEKESQKEQFRKKDEHQVTKRKSQKQRPMSFRSDLTYAKKKYNRDHSPLRVRREPAPSLDQIYKLYLKC